MTDRSGFCKTLGRGGPGFAIFPKFIIFLLLRVLVENFSAQSVMFVAVSTPFTGTTRTVYLGVSQVTWGHMLVG